MYPINSSDYWEERFSSGDWDINYGKQQTAYFYRLLMRMMPQWAKQDIAQNNYDMVDFGCAEGQGLPILVAELGTDISGVDFSESAIKTASELYPSFRFETADVCKYTKVHDVSIASNIIEHFDTPFALLKHIASITRKYLVVMVPLEESNLMPEHKFTFFYNNIPICVDQFHLVYFAEYDCRNDEEQLFLGKQIFLLYSSDNTLSQGLSISSANGLLQLLEAQKKEQRLCENIITTLSEKLTDEIHNSNNYVASLLSQEMDGIAVQLGAMIRQNVDEFSQRYAENMVEAIDQKNLKIQTLNEEVSRLASLYNDVNGRFNELINRFNNLNDVYGLVVEENAKIKTSRTYKFAKLTWKIADKLHLIGMVRWLLKARHVGLKQALKQRKTRMQVVQEDVLLSDNFISEISDTTANGDPYEKEQIDALNYRKSLYTTTLSQHMTETAKAVADILAERTYKGIVVYPHAVHWEPVQRPQHFLRAFAEEGYIGFFCDAASEGVGCEEKYPNVFVVYGEENLLWPLQDKCPIVLMTYHMQIAFVDALPHKVLWFDLLDNLDFFSGGNSILATTIYNKLISESAIVSYSADNLKGYIPQRNDAIKLNNGVMLSDFMGVDNDAKIERLESIKQRNSKIIGYYGAIEEWFDKDAIRTLLEKTDFEIVLIGHVGISFKDIQNERLHFLGMVPYRELRNYTKYFDLAIIPFIKNKLTDSVSPVKFYEYVAQGLPVLSSDIQEMRQYVTDQVCIYHNTEELVNLSKNLCAQVPDKDALRKIAEENTWINRIQKVIEALSSMPVGLHAFADFRKNGTVAVETVTFFKYDGSTYYSGGAERYLLDLQEVCSELNVPYRVYQYGEYNWVRFYNDVEVMGMQAVENDVNFYSLPLINEMNAAFEKNVSQSSKLAIYSPFYILTNHALIPTVGISHGISWDGEHNHFTDGNMFWQINKNIIDGAGYCDRMISVDTNTCNWFQTLDYDTGRKIRYIPNYVDNEEFCPREDYLKPREKIIIIYPRRLYGARGLYVVVDVIDDILERYFNVEFHFVGKGFEQDTKYVEKKITKWGERVKWYSKAPSQMHEVYKMADVSLVPTMYSEGTSLSCLEALSSGNVVIATRVGGLTDLILSDYNGKLVEPTGESIKEALFDLLDHPEKMQQLKKNAVETARAFSKTKWKKEWKKIIAEYAFDGNTYTAPSRCIIQLKSEAQLKNVDTLNLIREHLEKGWYVYVACKNNPMRYSSYKRLQYIDIDEDLYFTPEKTIVI